jgi:phosphoglycolate phosphatase
MSRRYRMIVFDWDGTLLDSAAAIVSAIQMASRDLGLGNPEEHRARYVIGLGLADALRHAVPDLPEHRYPEMVDRYRFHYLSRDHELTLFAGVADLVRELSNQGHVLAVATGKSRIGLDRAFAVSGLGHHFHASRCADECRSKPHPQMLQELLDEFGLAPEDALMIGDTTHDLQMAANAGVDSVGVAYGAHPAGALHGLSPRAVVHDVPGLAAWLREHG